jgi:hypothetical protein
MSSASGKYVIKGKVSSDIWDRHKDSVLKPLEVWYEEDGDAKHVSLYMWDYSCGENSYAEWIWTDGDYAGKFADIELEFLWDDDCHSTTYTIFESMIKRVEMYSILDTSSKWGWVADRNTFRGGHRSTSESGMSMGTIG